MTHHYETTMYRLNSLVSFFLSFFFFFFFFYFFYKALARVEPAAVQGIIQIAITLMTHKSMSVSERLFPFWSKLTDYDTTPSWNQAVFVPLTQVAVLTGAYPTGTKCIPSSPSSCSSSA